MKNKFEINGVITTNSDVTEEQVTDVIIEFIESKGWTFGGSVNEYEEEDEKGPGEGY